MAQLNPNFEIDFNDINSYEQIQLINDTQLAKENLLMHKAYKEPAEDEIIRNQFSSFTFVDFCPKLFNSASKSSPDDKNAPHTSSSSPSAPLRHHQYMLETFSDLFDRINLWLRVNRDWRVISMETLIFDCASQFNHLKSSFHSANLPRNMRGLRLYLSPTKSRFSGPQKIGCINVIPRKISSRKLQDDGSDIIEYETLDQILARLNELLLTRPIEGRILSVETITLPIVNGYVNTETNYFMDNRLNALSQRIYSHANDGATAAARAAKQASPKFETMQQPAGEQEQQAAGGEWLPGGSGQQQQQRQQPLADGDSSPSAKPRAHQPNGLIDTLRVYYEFGPMVCGLVNLIDFLPRFNLRQAATSSTVASPTPDRDLDRPSERDADGSSCEDQPQAPLSPPPVEQQDIDSTESLTRLIGRSLTWFEAERKRVLAESAQVASNDSDNDDLDSSTSTSSDTETESGANTGHRLGRTGSKRQQVNLKMCNLQIHTKVMLKSRLAKVTPQTALDVVESRQMFHEPPREPVVCHQCGQTSVSHEPHEWCSHLLDLNQAFELKFVRLAYVVPVCNEYATRFTRSLRSLPSLRTKQTAKDQAEGLSSEQQQQQQLSKPLDPQEQARCSPSKQVDDNESPLVVVSKSVAISDGDKTEVTHGPSRSSSRASTSHEEGDGGEEESEEEDDDDEEEVATGPDDEVLDDILAAHESAEKLAKEASLDIVNETNRRHKRYEQLHQLNEESTSTTAGDGAELGNSASPEPGQLIGQLTYRLFAPCQLVNSSSCFSINPVNSSNPLARRGSVVSDGDDNATPSTLLLPSGGGGFACESLSESTLTINSGAGSQDQQQVISFGAFFPALSHDAILGAHNNQRLGLSGQQHASKGSNSHRFATNEFEPVEAIRRRMEVYVTTNSMKVLAGETLVVNLSDHLSCLSNAIEQTIIKASFSATRQPSTWVSVYILYAAVDEPHLPSQLLEQQKLRDRLELISEADEDEQLAAVQEEDTGETAARAGDEQQELAADQSAGEHNMVPVFDDDFKCEQQTTTRDQDQQEAGPSSGRQRIGSQTAEQGLGNTLASLNLENGSIRVELSRSLGPQTDLPPYNSAYDRTVALPTQPDDHLTNYLEPVDVNLAGSWALQQQQHHQPQQHQPLSQASAGANVWLDENDLIEVRSYQLSNSNVRDASKLLRMRQQQQQQQVLQTKPGGAELRNSSPKGARGRKVKGKRRARRSGEHSQCSIM